MRTRFRCSPAWPMLAIGGLLGLAACEDDVGIADVQAGIRLEPAALDFGNVQVGEASPGLQVFARNVGTGVLNLELGPGATFDAESFRYDIDRTSVSPNGVAVINVVFTPLRTGLIPSTLVLTTNVDGSPTIEIPLQGTGVTTTLTVDPQRVDFRNVVVGTTKTLPVNLTNNSAIDAEIEYLGGNNVKLCSDGPSEPGAFCVRFRDISVDSQRRFDLRSGANAQLEVQFAPVVAGTRSDGFFTLKTCASSACEVRVTLTGFAVEAGLRCRPSSLDFGQINPGQSAARSVTCENIANEPVTLLTWGITPTSNAAFRAEAARPQVLNEGQTVSIEATYAPTALGDAAGILRLETDNPNPALRNIDVALRGTGGGPDIEVLPPQLNFGRVSLIAPSRRNIVITNTGFGPLTISEIQVDTLGTNSFTSPDANANVLQPGQSQTVTIEFTPSMEGMIESRVRIVSNDADEQNLEVVVRGEGVNLPPCNFSVVPVQLNFGTVARTRSLRRAFEIRNNSDPAEPENICLITSVRLLSGSDPSFSLPGGDIISREIAPGSAQVVEVEFLPTAAGTFTGQVEFSISSPTSPFNTVDLSGVGADSTLLIVPNELNFGTIGVGCASRARAITIYNTGGTAVRIDSINLAMPPQPAFSVASRPSPLPTAPLNLAAGQSTTFDIGFRAAGVSSYAGAVEINTTEGGTQRTYIVSLLGRGAVDATQVDEFEQLGKPKVDILFVIDDSCSMSDEQTSLGSNFQAFIQFAEAQAIDYNLGVTTTDVDGGANSDNGRLASAQPGTTGMSGPNGPPQYRIVTPQTVPSPSAVFAANTSVGISGSGFERPLEAAEKALTPPNIFGHNSGFIRPDAVLSIIFVTDELEQSSGSVDYYINLFLSIKGFRNTNLFSASSINAPFPPGNCSGPGGSAQSDNRLISVVNRTGGVFQSICTSDWSRSLEDLSTTAFGFKSRFFLTNQPIQTTLRIFIDGVEVPAQAVGGSVNWSYDFSTNSINFAPYSTPEPGSQIRVEYTAECL